MTEPKIGGAPELRVALLGGSDVLAALQSTTEGGPVGTKGFSDAVEAAYGDRFSVVTVGTPVESTRQVLDMLRNGADVFEPTPDIVVLSVRPDVESTIDPAEFRTNLKEIFDTVKERFDARIVVFNASTYDPADSTTTFAAIDSPWPHRIHQLDLELMKLSESEGVSIVDIDRLVAELGAVKHVPAVMELSERALDVVGAEFMRIVQDYGFFEERPLLAQVGKGSS